MANEQWFESRMKKETFIKWKDRRKDFAAYIEELKNPSDKKRQKLLKELLDLFYSSRPQLLVYLEADIPEFFTIAQDPNRQEEAREAYEKFLQKVNDNEKKFKYNDVMLTIVRFLRVGYTHTATEDKAKEFIEQELSKSRLPQELRKGLLSEYLKVWKLNYLLFDYLGDIAEQLDGMVVIYMAEGLLFRKIPRSKAINFLFDEFFENRLTGGLPLKFYLLQKDIAWSLNDLLMVAGEKDELKAGTYSVKFGKTKTEAMSITSSAEVYKKGKRIASCQIGDFMGIMLEKPPADEKEAFKGLCDVLSALSTILLDQISKNPQSPFSL